MDLEKTLAIHPWENTKFAKFLKYFRESPDFEKVEDERKWLEVYEIKNEDYLRMIGDQKSNRKKGNIRLYLLNPDIGDIVSDTYSWSRDNIWSEKKLSDKFVIIGRDMNADEIKESIHENEVDYATWEFVTYNNNTLIEDKRFLLLILKNIFLNK